MPLGSPKHVDPGYIQQILGKSYIFSDVKSLFISYVISFASSYSTLLAHPPFSAHIPRLIISGYRTLGILTACASARSD